ncbi:transmembrane emp24 domain-containing protein 7-like isoform X2 [Branchiostoma floridae]|uniref:Transmembrane emp24 domain-containing protein 7-like isoform X2 n=1 Tax=Branchiostoma floridae TaxID=7739 RepID=A0A9J7KSH5_BRAFL|nr:transmembrane emp24 domain-containing protein 7-like isoform X2 [Branchiostoma floridae]
MEGPWTAGLVVLTCYVAVSLAGELTFELADNDRQCFYEDVDAGVKCTLEYQVVTGGHYDVDCLISDPNEKVLYKEIKKQYDTYTWTSEKKGVYKFCFSNEFSTFTHKTVYFDFMVGEEPPLIPEMGDHDTALTQMETSCVTAHENLKLVIDYQTHFRLREAQGRAFAESLNERVNYWSIAQTVILILVGIGQVVVLRSFFTENKKHQGI